MPFQKPFTLGPFVVDRDGYLTHASADASPAFTFQWRGRLLRAAMQADGTLTLRADLGRVPSTASHRMPERQQIFELLRALATTAPAGWHVFLLPDHRAVLDATIRLPDPMTAAGLLTAITAFLLRLAPYLDLVDEAGMPTGS